MTMTNSGLKGLNNIIQIDSPVSRALSSALLFIATVTVNPLFRYYFLCRNNDLSEYRPVGLSTCRNIDLSEYRPVCRNIDLLD